MPEPTSSTVALATMAAAGASMPVLTAFGVPLGLRPDFLIAGFCGALAAIVLLDSVPGTSDTWQQLLRTTMRRMFVCIASSLTAGYLAPLALLLAKLPDPLVMSVAFGVGGGAQQVLVAAIRRFSGPGATQDAAGGA